MVHIAVTPFATAVFWTDPGFEQVDELAISPPRGGVAGLEKGDLGVWVQGFEGSAKVFAC